MAPSAIGVPQNLSTPHRPRAENHVRCQAGQDFWMFCRSSKLTSIGRLGLRTSMSHGRHEGIAVCMRVTIVPNRQRSRAVSPDLGSDVMDSVRTRAKRGEYDVRGSVISCEAAQHQNITREISVALDE